MAKLCIDDCESRRITNKLKKRVVFSLSLEVSEEFEL